MLPDEATSPEQYEIFRRMTPAERWQVAHNLYWSMRRYKTAFLESQHPDCVMNSMPGRFAVFGVFLFKSFPLPLLRRSMSSCANSNISVKEVRKNLCAISARCWPSQAICWIGRRLINGFDNWALKLNGGVW
jgi:hypothetical protein